MKTSKTKRALAFWLAVAMLASSAPMAMAVDSPQAQTPVVYAQTQSGTIEKMFGETISDSELRNALSNVPADATVTYAVTSGNEVISYSGSTVTLLKVGTGTITATITPKAEETNPTDVDNAPGNVTPRETTTTQTITIHVKAASLSSATVTLSGHENLTYTGEEQKPSVTKVVVDSKELSSADDYTVSYADNTNAGTAKVIVTGKGNYTGTKETTFSIEKAEPEFKNNIQVTMQNKEGMSLDNDVLPKLSGVTATGKKGETISGTFSNLEVVSKQDWSARSTPDFAGKGIYTLSAKFTPSSSNYEAVSNVTITCDVTGQQDQTAAFNKTTATITFGDTADVIASKLPTLQNAQGKVEYTSSNPAVATVTAAGIVSIVKVGTTEITAAVEGNGDYASGTAQYTLTVAPKPLEANAVTLSPESYTYDGNAKTPTVEVKDGQATLVNGTDYTVAYSDNTNAGTAKVTVTLKGNYSGTVSKNFTINKGKYTGDGVSDNKLALTGEIKTGESKYLPIPDAIAKMATKTELNNVVDGNLIFNGKPTLAPGNGSALVKIESSATNGKTGTFDIVVSSANYEPITITYTVTAKTTGKKTMASSNIEFNDRTVNYDGAEHGLTDAKIKNGVTTGNSGSFTYVVTSAPATRATTATPPKFKEVGTYTIRAYYSDNDYEGYKDATLTIKSANILSFSVSKNNDKDNDNYSDYKYTTVEKNGYFKIEAKGKDDLTSFKVNGSGSKEYWIGFDITPKLGTSTFDAKNLYYRTSSSGSWKALTDGTYGDFYIDVGSTDMTVWLDTRNDKDNKEDIYLATNSSGANEVELIVDFDSYNGDDDDDDKSSSGTNTKKVDGDKVTTTKVNKSPSVKSKKATASFSSSAITDAIDDVKKGYKDDKADKKVIHLDVDTSKSCDETVVTIPTKSVDKIADADASLKIETAQGTFMIDEDALANLADDASGSDIDFCIEEIDDDEFRLYAKSSKKYLTDLGKGEAEIVLSYTLKKNEKAADVRVYRIGDAEDTYLAAPSDAVYGALDVMGAVVSGTVTEMKDAEYKSKKVTFTADDLGTFRITTDVLTTGTTTTPPTNPGTSSTFYDVPMSRWSAPYIYKLANAGIVSGTGGNMFQPTLYVSREEFVKMLAGVAGANVSAYTGSKFSDVPTSRWSAPYIAWAASLGVTNGDTASTFAPTKYITRQEMAAMIYRYVQISGKTLPTRNTAKNFTDSSLISSWATAAVSTMQQAGIIDGNALSTGGYAFEPLTSASREECAKMLAVLYDLI